MQGTEKLDELKFNDVVETIKLFPGLEKIVGESSKYVGKIYVFEGSNGCLQELKLWAKGFEISNYEE
jgi:hypothetical protein